MFEKHWKVEGHVAIPHSKHNFYINVSGEVINDTGRKVELTKDDDGHSQVFADLWDGLRQYRIMDLIAIIFKKVSIPVSLWNEVSGFPLDGDLTNAHASNVGYRFRSGPLQCPNYPEFYYVPMFTKYGMDEDGVLAYIAGKIGIKKWGVVTPTPEKNKKNIRGGYRITGIYSDVSSKYSMVSRHRLKMIVFAGYPDELEKLVVNHKDGVAGNDELENLEWTTRSQNNQHASDTGLRGDNKPVLVRNVLTGKVDRYYSIADCGRSLTHVSEATLNWRLANSEFSKVFFDGLQFKLEEDSRDWIVPEDPQKAVEAAKLSKPVLVKNISDGSVEWYSSATTAGKAIGVKGSTLTYRLSNDLRVPYLGHQFKYEDDTRDWYVYSEAEIVTEALSTSKAVVVATPEGEIDYPSISQAKKYHPIPNVTTYLARGVQPQYSNGLSVRMFDDDWEPEKFESVFVSGFAARHIGTGEEVFSRSARSLGATLNVPSAYVRRCVESKGELVYGTYQFRTGDIKEPWPKIPEEDVKVILTGVPKSGVWKKVTNIETGEVRYFGKAEDVAKEFGWVGNTSVFKAIANMKLINGKFKVDSYRPACLLNTQ